MTEAGNITVEKARELVADQLLWPRVRDFLWDFAPSIHPSWIEWKLGRLEDAESGRVRRYILDSFGVGPLFHGFPREDGSRLALLDGAKLLEIAGWLGALACAKQLRNVVDGGTVRALKAALPGIYPDVFGYTAYFAASGLEAADAEVAKGADEIASVGLGIILSRLGACPPALVERVKLKFPHPLVARAAESGRGAPEAAGASRDAALKKLFKLKFPEAYSLCYS